MPSLWVLFVAFVVRGPLVLRTLYNRTALTVPEQSGTIDDAALPRVDLRGTARNSTLAAPFHSEFFGSW